MRNSILEMASSSQRPINLLLQTAHSATICGQTGCGKQFSSWICSKAPTGGSFNTSWSCARPYGIIRPISSVPESGRTPRSNFLTPGERLHDHLRAFYHVFMGEPTLYIIDDCSASTALTKKKDMLSMLAFLGRHAEQSVWVLTQKYNSVLKDLREQTRWVCLFHCKDCDSFEDCLRENDVIPLREQRVLVRQQLAETKHAKLLLKTDQPVCYIVLSDVKQ